MTWQDKFASREDFHREVKRLVMECGLSYSRAAETIGSSTTKNQVVRAMQTILGKTRGTVTFPDSVWPSTAKTPGEKAVDVPEVPVHLTAVREQQCRAPLWPDFLHSQQKVHPSEHMMCGNKCKEGSAYCEEHHALFYPAELQKRAAPKSRTKRVDNAQHFR